ncbi:hypothetical protein M885DRAFT_616748 [Pelagophyceae sp. CCMP2097]|nr:hypothetical protein M885DRAFT_616748 [Pelagophyceae sp. CCMP2097]
MAAQTWSVVKGSTDLLLAKLPGGPLSAPWMADGQLDEELESEVSEDEDAFDWRARGRGKQKFQARRTKQRATRWRMSSEKGDLIGSLEGGQAAAWVCLKETAPGCLEIVQVRDWFNFRVPVASKHKTKLTADEANDAYKQAQKDALKVRKPASRLEARLNALGEGGAALPGADAPKGRGGGGRGGGARVATGAAVDTELYGGATSSSGLNAAGEDVEAREINDGAGDVGLDFDEEFQDDEADEEKHDNEGLNFHDVNSDDEQADLTDDEAEPDAKKKIKDKDDADAMDVDATAEEGESRKRAKPDGEEAEDGKAKPFREDRKKAKIEPAALLTEQDIRNELSANGGRMKTKDLLLRFKKRLKENPANKQALRTHLKNAADIVDDALDGRVLVLKPPQKAAKK